MPKTKVSPKHKSHAVIKKAMQKVLKKVIIGAVYAHYKNFENQYKVIAIGTLENTDDLCVIYQEKKDAAFVFVRDLDSWLEPAVVDSKKVPRFKLVKKP